MELTFQTNLCKSDQLPSYLDFFQIHNLSWLLVIVIQIETMSIMQLFSLDEYGSSVW